MENFRASPERRSRTHLVLGARVLHDALLEADVSGHRVNVEILRRRVVSDDAEANRPEAVGAVGVLRLNLRDAVSDLLVLCACVGRNERTFQMRRQTKSVNSCQHNVARCFMLSSLFVRNSSKNFQARKKQRARRASYLVDGGGLRVALEARRVVVPDDLDVDGRVVARA